MIKCEILVRDTTFLAGFSFSGPFPQSFPSEAVNVQQLLENRKSDFLPTVNTDIVFSPYYVCETLATYFACYEVSEGAAIPEGMVTFKLPGHTYARVTCTNKTITDGYDAIFDWIQTNGHKQLNGACSIEIFYKKDTEQGKAEILIPVE
ncbi:GyrI-like domain-containing protein [Cohnella lupini]|uniref:Putative transcriptional regulator YdeE n=1 Tax=Cohnella lupini TaxID=1294267 RepID=A0A3D9INF9_9BACL|nr:effector binding domain-containing protein [Cohnella lupini]RED63302.1 putative transcriptional regulator YdeE [Cohnella lupini]